MAEPLAPVSLKLATKFIRAPSSTGTVSSETGKIDRKTTVIDTKTGKEKDATPFIKKGEADSSGETKETVTILSNAEKEGLIDSRVALEILASPGDVGVHLERGARKLIASEKLENQAKGLDMQCEGLLIQKAQLQKPQDADGKPLTKEAEQKNALKLNHIEERLTETIKKRQELTEKRPDLAGNQFEDMARALVPGELQKDESGNVLGLKSMNDYFDRLTQATQDQRVGVLHDWKLKGVPDNISKTLQGILFKEEIATEHKDRIKRQVKNTSIILALLTVIGAWAAAKKAGADGQTGGR